MHRLTLNAILLPSPPPASPACPQALALSLAQSVAPGHRDELRGGLAAADRAAGLAPEWGEFFDHLGAEGLADLNRREQSVARQLRDNGVTYNVYADQDSQQRPWSIDLFPLIIPAAQWTGIEAGVLQRARLLNTIMTDLYGPQLLLQQGFLPPALVQGHPGYLRAMRGLRPAGETWLHVVAVDLAHGPDGRWRVVSHRTQSPSGLGVMICHLVLSMVPSATIWSFCSRVR